MGSGDEPSEPRFEGVAPEPISADAAAVPRLEPVRPIDGEAADAVDLRLAGVAVGISDRGAERSGAVVRDEHREDVKDHDRIVSRQPKVDCIDEVPMIVTAHWRVLWHD